MVYVTVYIAIMLSGLAGGGDVAKFQSSPFTLRALQPSTVVRIHRMFAKRVDLVCDGVEMRSETRRLYTILPGWRSLVESTPCSLSSLSPDWLRVALYVGTLRW